MKYNDYKVDDIMKNKILLILIIITSFFIVKVNAQETILTYNEKVTLDIDNISNITSYKDGYILTSETIDSTIIYNYNNENKLISTKELSSLTNTSILKYNDKFLIVGISNNILKCYILDSNLQIIKQQATEYMLDYDSKINIYLESDKAYIMITIDNQLSSNTIYEIDETLNIKEYTFSSLGPDKIKSILKGDYYLIHLNSAEYQGRIPEYSSSTYLPDKYILVGTEYNQEADSNGEYEYKGIITYIDSTGNIINNIVSDDLEIYSDIKVIKDKLVVLAYKDNTSYLLTYDFEGNLILSEAVDQIEDLNYANGMYKIGNKLAITTTKLSKDSLNNSEILFYSYNLNISYEESPYGTIIIPKTSIPFEKVEFTITPNSGYQVESVIIKDNQGANIKVSENSFIMPENDCIVIVNYKEVVENPETFDYILIITISLIIISIITINLYKKMSWLK